MNNSLNYLVLLLLVAAHVGDSYRHALHISNNTILSLQTDSFKEVNASDANATSRPNDCLGFTSCPTQWNMEAPYNEGQMHLIHKCLTPVNPEQLSEHDFDFLHHCSAGIADGVMVSAHRKQQHVPKLLKGVSSAGAMCNAKIFKWACDAHGQLKKQCRDVFKHFRLFKIGWDPAMPWDPYWAMATKKGAVMNREYTPTTQAEYRCLFDICEEWLPNMDEVTLGAPTPETSGQRHPLCSFGTKGRNGVPVIIGNGEEVRGVCGAEFFPYQDALQITICQGAVSGVPLFRFQQKAWNEAMRL